MTYDRYDEIENTVSKVTSKPDSFWPSDEELANLNLKHDDDVAFLIWLLNMNPEPGSEEERERRGAVQKFMYQNLQLT